MTEPHPTELKAGHLGGAEVVAKDKPQTRRTCKVTSSSWSISFENTLSYDSPIATVKNADFHLGACEQPRDY